MRLCQPPSGYRYTSDSLFLYDFIIKAKPSGTMLEVGAGCGVIGLLVARDVPKVQLEAIEIQEQFVKYAKKNALQNGIPYEIVCGDFLQMPQKRRYDYIISNPPYYHDGAKQSKNSMLAYARYSSYLPMEPFFQKVHSLLAPKGHFIFCYDASQFALVCAALEGAKMRILEARFVHPKQQRPASLVLVHARRDSRSMMQLLPPLYAFVEDRYSKEAQAIYDRAATKSMECVIE